MPFIPQPKQVVEAAGHFAVRLTTPIILSGTAPSALLYAELLRKDFTDFCGLPLDLARGEPAAQAIVLTVSTALPEDAYTLFVEREGVTVTGGSDESLLHGVMTLCQHVRAHGALLPCLHISDRPDLPNRGYYLDCSRGRVPTLETLKRYADLLVRYKVNQWQLYIEHTYLFPKLSEGWRQDTPLDASEIMALDRYCAERHIELVPSLSTFGHMYELLSTQTLEPLCERPDERKPGFSYVHAGEHHTLNVSHPDALPFIIGLIDEYRQLFVSKKFNICCDETFDLGQGRSKALCDAQGKENVYVDHVAALCRHLLQIGVTPMFWGDIIWRHPETYAKIPKGTVCLNWGYLPYQREDEIRILSEAGATQYACSGVCAWKFLLPLYETSFLNNRVMCAHAHKFGAIGLLNTDWGDWGHLCDPALTVPAIIYGAAFSWNAASADQETLDQAIGLLEYGDASGDLMRGLNLISDGQAFGWEDIVRSLYDESGWQARRAAYDLKRLIRAQEGIAAGLALIDRVAPRLRDRSLLQPLRIAALGASLFNRYGLWLLADGAVNAPSVQLAGELENWYRLYMNRWRAVSKEGTSWRNLDIVTRMADRLRGR